MKSFLLFISILICTISITAQENKYSFADEIIFGASHTYIRYAEDENEGKFHEFVTNVNISTNVFNEFYVGLSYLDIRNRYSNVLTPEAIKDNYYMAGAFVQYNFLKGRKDRLMGEVSYHYGNYCNCGKGNPYESANLSYFGFGAAYDLPLIKGLYLDTGFNVYTIINKREQKDIFAQYIIGLNYHFPLKSSL